MSMISILRTFTLTLVTFFCAISLNAQSSAAKLEITKARLSNLINTKSENLSILGLHLLMTEEEAINHLKASNGLLWEIDSYNRHRILVFEETAAKTKGRQLLYLVWDGYVNMKQITIFPEFGSYLTNDFKKLLTLEALNQKSPFMRGFIGSPTRSEESLVLDVPSVKADSVTYFYEKIGLLIVKRIWNGTINLQAVALVPSKTAGVEKVAAKRTDLWSPNPFDISQNTLSPNFVGHDIIEIYNALKKVKKPVSKDEFETTAAYRQRVEQERSKPFLGTLAINSLFAFESESLEATYDADNQVMDISLKLDVLWTATSLDNTRKSIHIDTDLVSTFSPAPKSAGMNATVKKTHGVSYRIPVVNLGAFNVENYISKSDRESGFTGSVFNQNSIQARIAMDIPTAKKVKMFFRKQ